MSEFDADAFESLSVPYSVEFHGSIPSTNDRGRTLAEDGASDVAVVAAEQTAGRGRKDRDWVAPEGGVYLSVVLAPEWDPADYPLATLAAAVATARSVRARGGDAAIKWPNDVLLPGGKLAGILTERVGDRVVVGVGINADVDPAVLPDRAATLRGTVADLDRAALVADVLSELSSLVADSDGILDAWRDLADTLRRRVAVETPDGTVVGVAAGIERPGTLLVETDEGLVRVSAGDCEHLRPADGG